MTLVPLDKPSVESIETVLTMFSPMWDWTSKINFWPSLESISKESYILGKLLFSPEKSTSTTGPIICETIPTLMIILLKKFIIQI